MTWFMKKLKKSISSKLHYLFIPYDFIITFALITLAFLAEQGITNFSHGFLPLLLYTLSISVLTVVVFAIFGVYRIITYNFGLYEALRMAIITSIIQVIGLVVIIFTPGLPDIGKYVYSWLLCAALLVLILPFSRLTTRIYFLLRNLRSSKNKVKTLIIGAGSAGKVAIDETRRNYENKNYVVGFVDDDKNKIGKTFAGIKVYGPISNIEKIVKETKAEEVIIAIADINYEALHNIIVQVRNAPVRIKRLPLLIEGGNDNNGRAFNISIDDLLGRPQVELNNSQLNEELKDSVVLVTGAGGSIGSELVRQIFNAKPAKLILFDIYENSTYEIQQELVRRKRRENHPTEIITLIGSTYNEKRINQIIKKYKPNYIYHAAAYKHVPLMEDSPAEAIRTNVIGTYNVAKAADKYGVKKMVLVSTDKAVRPTNVMGATKRFAETIIQYYAEKSQNTAYAAVRFGNVLGSNGSVIPLFEKQIKEGGPITITDKNILRYFMTIPEAVSLILQCGLFARGGEIFILDMGKPVKIIDLAEKMIRQLGLVPYKDIQIEEIGLRPGEKLYEELLLDKEKQTKTDNEKIYIEQKEKIYPIEDGILEIAKAFDLEDNSDIKTLLSKIITSYTISK